MSVIEILMLDDSEDDIYLTRQALKDQKINNKLTAKRTVNGAISYVISKIKEQRIPELFLVDLNLGGMGNGIEFIEWLNKQVALEGVAVVVLSSVTASPEMDKRLRALDISLFVPKELNKAKIDYILNKFEHLYLEEYYEINSRRVANN